MKRLFFNLVVLISFFIVYFYVAYRLSLDTNFSSNFIINYEAKFYMILFLLFFTFLFIFRRSVLKPINNKRLLLQALSLFFLALLIRITIPPKISRTMFDEDIYLDMAKQISLSGRSCLCDFGNATRCFRCEMMKWPVGHPFLLLFVYFFSHSFLAASLFISFLNSLTVVFVFFSAYLLFKKEKIAFFSALVFALLPVNILWSTSLSSDVTFSFFVSFTLFFLLLAIKSKNKDVYLLSLLALGLAVQAKAEAFILIPLYFLTIFLLDKKLKHLLKSTKHLIALIIVFLLIFPNTLHLMLSSRTDTWGSPGRKFSTKYLKENFIPNISYWFELPRFVNWMQINKYNYFSKQLYHPVIFTLFAIFGALIGMRKKRLETIVLILWFVCLFFLYASFYAGSVFYGVDVRFVLPQYVVFSILSGVGISYLVDLLKKRTRRLFEILVVLIFCYFLTYLPLIQQPPEEGSDARLYRQFAINFASKQPDNCYFVSHVTSIYSWLGKGHIQIWYINMPDFNTIVKNKKCVIFDKGYWCSLRAPICYKFENYNLKLLSTLSDRKHDKVYSFYRLTT